MSEESTGRRHRIEVNWVQALAGGLATMSSAVLLSTVGVAGTLIGAALGSILFTVGNAVYSHYLARTRERVAAAHALALERAREARSKRRSGTATAERGEPPGSGQAEDAAKDAAQDPAKYAAKNPVDDTADDGAEDRAEDEAETSSESSGHGGESVRWREALRGLDWKRIAVVAVAIFAVVMGLILAFELLAGRSLSSYTGGSSPDGPRTSLSLFGGDRARDSDSDDRPAPDSEQTGEERPSDHESGGPGAPSSVGPSEHTPHPEQDGTDEQPTPGDDGTVREREGPSTTPSTTPTPEPAPEPTPDPTSEPAQPTQVPTSDPAPEQAPQSAPAPPG